MAYAKRQKLVQFSSAQQLSVTINALEAAYRTATPGQKKILSTVLSKFEV